MHDFVYWLESFLIVWQENGKIGVGCALFEDFMTLSQNDLSNMIYDIFDGGKKNFAPTLIFDQFYKKRGKLITWIFLL